MIDERIRIQENYDMTMETAIDEAHEEGLERGRHEELTLKWVLSLINHSQKSRTSMMNVLTSIWM